MQNNQNPVQEVPDNLTPQQALAILVQGVQFAQTRGIYSLTDAELISKAVRLFTNAPAGSKLPESSDEKSGVPEVTVETPAVTPDEQINAATTFTPEG